MKKNIMIFALAWFCTMANAQTDNVKSYLNEYKKFVDEVEVMNIIRDEQYVKLDSVYDALTGKYHNTYKPMMTDDQIKLYTEYRTRYKRLVATKRESGFTNQLDSLGTDVSKRMKRTGSKVSGFLKGVFGSSKKSK